MMRMSGLWVLSLMVLGLAVGQFLALFLANTFGIDALYLSCYGLSLTSIVATTVATIIKKPE